MKMEIKSEKKFQPITIELTFETEEDVKAFVSKNHDGTVALEYEKINATGYSHPFNVFQRLLKYGK